MEQAQTASKQHYHLVTGEVVFVMNENLNAVRVNGIIYGDEQRIPVRVIAKAQQVLQMNFFKKNHGEDLSKVKVIDVIVIGFSYLGQFLPEEFHKTPEGTTMQEMETAPDAKKASGPALVTTSDTLENAVTEAKKN